MTADLGAVLLASQQITAGLNALLQAQNQTQTASLSGYLQVTANLVSTQLSAMLVNLRWLNCSLNGYRISLGQAVNTALNAYVLSPSGSTEGLGFVTLSTSGAGATLSDDGGAITLTNTP